MKHYQLFALLTVIYVSPKMGAEVALGCGAVALIAAFVAWKMGD
jgi:hypothetical protein